MAFNLSRYLCTIFTGHKESPVLVVILGGTGNLAYVKLAPSLYKLENVNILGCGLENYSKETYYQLVKNSIINKFKMQEAGFDSNFKNRLSYLGGNFEDKDFYKKLNKYLEKFRSRHKNKKVKIIIYFAIIPKLLPTIISNLTFNKDISILVEKPFGHDTKTAIELNEQLLSKFTEQQIFRVEHYLAKNILGKINDFRYKSKFKNINNYLNKKDIDKITVSLIEEINVDGRGVFYDKVGAIKDVGQNHLLQILTLMICNSSSNATEEKVAFLKSLTESIDLENTFIKLNQYEGYRNILGVDPDSQIETAFKINTEFTSGEFEGVELCLQGGKSFGLKELFRC